MTSSEHAQAVLPGSTIGIIGGGQLGQMLASSAVEMGYRVVVLEPTPDCPASRVAEQIVAGYDDAEAMRLLAERCDVVTYEFENVSALTLGGILEETWIPQGTRALEICQHRLAEKDFLAGSGIPVAPFAAVPDAAALDAAVDAIGFPAVLKTVEGGYDGKGQVVLRGKEDLGRGRALVDQAGCVLEKWIEFALEASVVVAGNPAGQYVCFPAAENIHRNNILHMSIVPARVPAEVAERAKNLALRIAGEIGLVGVLGVEMFVTAEGDIYVNELAPRPHNSGHFTIEACSQSQFDLHIRGVCGLPLAQPQLLSPGVMVNVLGQHLPGTLDAMVEHPDWSVHLYGKADPKRDRKMGHVTLLRGDTAAALDEVRSSGIWA